MENLSITENIEKTWIKKIKMYKDIFWEAPWNEWFICRNCWRNYSKNFMWNCSCDKPDIEPFYKNKELKQNFEETSILNWYKELIAKILWNEVWFIWWWITDISELNTLKLKLNEEQLLVLFDSIKKVYPNFNYQQFYYFSEIGVNSYYRWNDVAWKLYRKNLDDLKKTNSEYILVRTTKLSDLPYKWFLKEKFIDVFSYNDEQDRVILIKKI